jgi:hypothetical protein
MIRAYYVTVDFNPASQRGKASTLEPMPAAADDSPLPRAR